MVSTGECSAFTGSNHEGFRTVAGAKRFMVRQAHHEALLQRPDVQP